MCFSPDSHPPMAPIAGAAVEHHHLTLTAADGNRFAAFRADAAQLSGRGILVLPDVRGLYTYYEELALRFAEIGIDALALDYYGRTAGPSRRDDAFDVAAHVPRSTWAGLQADVSAAAQALRDARGTTALYAIGFCYGGRLSLLLASLPGLELAGVIAFYGWPVGPFRNDMPAPIDRVAAMHAPVLAIFGGADKGIPAADVGAFEAALGTSPVSARVVTYAGAPHSFFDRKATEFADASEQAWSEVLAFLEGAGPG